MADSVFLDTNGWLALLNASDSLHVEADRVWRSIGKNSLQIVVSDWVIAETGNGLARSQIRSHFAEAVRRIETSPCVELIYVDSELLHKALTVYEQHRDKSWGLVDCVSFVLMQDKNVYQALTSDRHFEQAGFRCLLPAR